METYHFHPGRVAATMRLRWEAGLRHGLTTNASPNSCQVGAGPSPLFRLTASSAPSPVKIWSPFGEAELSLAELEICQPDPLWESADGICSHMEVDHADTFATFLDVVGESSVGELAMPWIESSGFFLQRSGDYAFLPFPSPCLDANSVRATLIKMLRGARANR